MGKGTAEITPLAADAAASAGQIEQQRALPPALVGKLKRAGAFRMLIPQAFGGLDVPFEEFLAVIQTFAQADASTAWCINQAAVIATTSLWLPETKIREIWATPDTAVANGPPLTVTSNPTSRAMN